MTPRKEKSIHRENKSLAIQLAIDDIERYRDEGQHPNVIALALQMLSHQHGVKAMQKVLEGLKLRMKANP